MCASDELDGLLGLLLTVPGVVAIQVFRWLARPRHCAALWRSNARSHSIHVLHDPSVLDSWELGHGIKVSTEVLRWPGSDMNP